MDVPDDLELFAQMCFLRHFEERADLLYRRGLIHGPVHLGLGHEAIAVGAAAMAGRPLSLPPHVTQTVLVLLGISLGSVVSKQLIKHVGAYPEVLFTSERSGGRWKVFSESIARITG